MKMSSAACRFVVWLYWLVAGAAGRPLMYASIRSVIARVTAGSVWDFLGDLGAFGNLGAYLPPTAGNNVASCGMHEPSVRVVSWPCLCPGA